MAKASEQLLGNPLDGLVTPEVIEAVTKHFLADLLVRKLGKGGVRVTSRQRARLVKWLRAGTDGEPPLPREAKKITKDLTISISARDERRLKGQVLGQTAAAAIKAMTTTAEQMARPALRGLNQGLLRLGFRRF